MDKKLIESESSTETVEEVSSAKTEEHKSMATHNEDAYFEVTSGLSSWSLKQLNSDTELGRRHSKEILRKIVQIAEGN